MAGPISQSESDVIHKRLVNVANSLRGINEEIVRLKSENITVDFSTNLDEPSGGSGLTKAESLAFVTGPLFDYADYFANVDSVASDGVADSSDRRDKMNPLLLAEPLI